MWRDEKVEEDQKRDRGWPGVGTKGASVRKVRTKFWKNCVWVFHVGGYCCILGPYRFSSSSDIAKQINLSCTAPIALCNKSFMTEYPTVAIQWSVWEEVFRH